jgi:hypothetical protein
VQVTKRSKAKVQARRSTVKTFIKVGLTHNGQQQQQQQQRACLVQQSSAAVRRQLA